MEAFITANPGVIKYIFWGLLATCIYFWKANERKSARLICEQLKELSKAITMLVKNDARKERRLSEMQSQIDQRAAMCDERSRMFGARFNLRATDQGDK